MMTTTPTAKAAETHSVSPQSRQNSKAEHDIAMFMHVALLVYNVCTVIYWEPRRHVHSLTAGPMISAYLASVTSGMNGSVDAAGNIARHQAIDKELKQCYMYLKTYSLKQQMV